VNGSEVVAGTLAGSVVAAAYVLFRLWEGRNANGAGFGHKDRAIIESIHEKTSAMIRQMTEAQEKAARESATLSSLVELVRDEFKRLSAQIDRLR